MCVHPHDNVSICVKNNRMIVLAHFCKYGNVLATFNFLNII